MSRVQAWAGLAFVAVGLPLGLYLSEWMILLKQVPLPKPPQVLSDRAAELARSLLGAGGEASAYGFVYHESLEGHQVLPVPALTKLPRAPIQFWYRVAPRRLDAINPYGAVTPRDPPPTEPGMAELRLDTRGRLLRFDGVQGLDARSGGPPPDWAPAFREAGLDLSRFRPAAPALVPRVYADVRLAWDGEDPEEPGHALRVEAAAFGDRPVMFRILDGPPTAPATARRRGALTFNLIFLAMLPVAAVAARRNVRLGRGDRRGALRLAAFAFAARLLAWVLEAPYERLARGDLALLAAALSRALYSAAVLWLFYMAIEPSLRRRWPEALISWSRVLAGRFRDPRVGRDVLMGVVTAVAMALAYSGGQLLAKGFGASPALHLIVDLDILLGLRPFLASFLLNQVNAISAGLFFMLALLLTRVLVRDLRVAAALWAVLLTSMSAVGAGISHWAEMISVLVVIGLLIALILRFGLLALIVTSFLLGPGRAFVPFTLDLGAWYGQAALAWLLVGLALAVFGFYASMAGRPLLGGRLLD